MKKILSVIIATCICLSLMFSIVISAETTTEYYGYLVGLGDSWCQGVGLGSADMETKNAVTLTANTLDWRYKNFGQGGKYANDVLSQMKNTESDQYKEMLEADTVFVHGGINDISSNYRPSMVGNSYWDYSDLSNITQKFNLGYIPKNYDPETGLIGGYSPEQYFYNSLNNATNNTVKILNDVADIITDANPDALIVISTLYCNYTGGIAEFPEGFTFEGLTDAEKLAAADEMADYYFRKYFQQANAGIKEFAAKYDNVVVLDDDALIPQQERSGDVNDYMNAGHPKAAGYQLLSDGMVSLIREYYGEESPLFAHTTTTAATTTNTTVSETTSIETTTASDTAVTSTSVEKLVAFGDSVIFGACMGGPNANADAYGDQKVVDLLGEEFGLTRYTSTDKIKSNNAEKWFFNSSASGATTGQIYEKQVQNFDSELLSQADVIYMNGGTNDACMTMSKFLGGCGWGATCAEWTLEETKKYIEDNSSTMAAISKMIKENFVKIITYIADLDGFDGKIVIQNYPNQFAGSENTNAEYLWDEFYERAVTSGQRAAIEQTKDIYDNIVLLDVTAKVRDGTKYTGVTYGDAQHLTFEGNRAIYKELSLLLNSDGANLLKFESTEIPANAVWRTVYDFEQYDVGESNVEGAAPGYNINNVIIADMSETYDEDGNPKSGSNNNSTKALKCIEQGDNGVCQAKIDISSYTKNAYGFRLRFTYPADNNKMKYFEFHTTTGKSFIKVFPINNTEWGQMELSAGSSMYESWYSTMLNISDIQTIDYFKIWGNAGTCYYLDDIEVLVVDETLPQTTATSTTATTTTTITTTAMTLPSTTQPTTAQPTTTVPTIATTQVPTTTYPTTQPTTPATTVKKVNLGDVNTDGNINGKDVLALRKYIVALDNNIDVDNADCNKDGKINGKDVLQLRKYIIGLVKEL